MDFRGRKRYIKGMNSKVVRVFLVDDHPVVREGLEFRIKSMPGFSVCGSAAESDAAAIAIKDARPDIVILDLSLGGNLSFSLAEAIKSRMTSVKILVYTLFEDANSIERAFRSGADGYCTKGESMDQVEAALRQIVKGERYIREDLKDKLLTRLLENEARGTRDPVLGLSSKEFTVFSMIGKGYAIDEIAAELGLSPKTVNNHRDNIRVKLGISSARELVQYAIRWIYGSEASARSASD